MALGPRRLLAGVALLVASKCASGRRFHGRGTSAVHATPRVGQRRRALSRGAALLLAAAPLPAGAQFHDVEAEFGQMDSDGDGFATKHEFIWRARMLLEEMGTTDDETIMRSLQRMQGKFDQADLNGDGKLDMHEAEYSAYLAEMDKRAADGSFDDAEVQRIFNTADKDKDGKMSRKELLLVMSADAGTEGGDIVVETFGHADLDGDQSLSKDEFVYASWRLKRIMRAGESMLQDLVRSFYHLWDYDRDGLLTKKELVKAAEAAEGFAREGGNLPPVIQVASGIAQEHFDHYDSNSDGRWDVDEVAAFAGYVVARHTGGHGGQKAAGL